MLKDYPLVSIITVVYNGAGTIEQTIQSVLSQPYQNIEYIIIDGGSTDGTQDIVNKYKEHISYFVSEKDNGIYDAMNKGIRRATGDIIGIINSDDWYDQNAVSKALKAFELNTEAGLVYGNVILVDQEGEEQLLLRPELETIWYQMAVPHPTVFIRKNVYEEHGLFDLQYSIASDYELILRLYSRQVVFQCSNDLLVHFRMGGLSQSRLYECRYETCEIAYRYIDMCPHKEHILPLLEDKRNWLLFEGTLTSRPKILEELLFIHFRKTLSEIVIFGAGFWGRRCLETLVGNGIEVDFVVDNNPDCRSEICGRSIRPADALQKQDMVLIAVKDHAYEIEKQLDKLGIEKYVSIGRLMEEYLSNHKEDEI